MQVRATDTGAVDSVAASIKTTFKGSSVTTASDLANRVGGSLSDARSLSSKLGTALEILGLVAAVLIACLLTLASVSKRVREIGTLKALGWTQWTVVRQISGESVLQGALGGVIGALVGLAGAAAVNAYGWTLKELSPVRRSRRRTALAVVPLVAAAGSASARPRTPSRPGRRW